jgi:hypothetical protein
VEETDSDTNPTNVDTDIEGCEEADVRWLLDEDEDHPLEYYLNQEDEFDEDEFMDKDYHNSSLLPPDFIKERFHQ